MNTTSATSATAGNDALNTLLGANRTGPSTVDETGERFLKMLVAQMQNQDPLNPMDNAEVTSQMAQINTVSGISKLNTTMGEMSGLLTQMQTLQAAALVGRDVMLAGDNLVPDDTGVASGGFELDSPADFVTITIKDATGRVVGRVDQGATSTGRHGFDWTAPPGAPEGLRFSVEARTKGGQVVPARTLVTDTVDAVYADGGRLVVELRDRGAVDYAAARAFN
ncbi:MAG: flagellar hook assembly protein FlgD [Aquabacterium sp.]